MADQAKKVEVRLGAFSCSIEGFDDPVSQLREVIGLLQQAVDSSPALAAADPKFNVEQIESAIAEQAGEDDEGVIHVRDLGLDDADQLPIEDPPLDAVEAEAEIAEEPLGDALTDTASSDGPIETVDADTGEEAAPIPAPEAPKPETHAAPEVSQPEPRAATTHPNDSLDQEPVAASDPADAAVEDETPVEPDIDAPVAVPVSVVPAEGDTPEDGDAPLAAVFASGASAQTIFDATASGPIRSPDEDQPIATKDAVTTVDYTANIPELGGNTDGNPDIDLSPATLAASFDPAGSELTGPPAQTGLDPDDVPDSAKTEDALAANIPASDSSVGFVPAEDPLDPSSENRDAPPDADEAEDTKTETNTSEPAQGIEESIDTKELESRIADLLAGAMEAEDPAPTLEQDLTEPTPSAEHLQPQPEDEPETITGSGPEQSPELVAATAKDTPAPAPIAEPIVNIFAPPPAAAMRASASAASVLDDDQNPNAIATIEDIGSDPPAADIVQAAVEIDPPATETMQQVFAAGETPPESDLPEDVAETHRQAFSIFNPPEAPESLADNAIEPDPAPEPPAGPGQKPASRFGAFLARIRGSHEEETPADPPAPEPMKDWADGAKPTATDIAALGPDQSVAEQLAASAAWLMLVEANMRFTRRQVMDVLDGIPMEDPHPLSDRIKGFGKLVRTGRLVLVEDGVFALSQDEANRFKSMIETMDSKPG